jgi:hypothetical protein
MRAQLIARRLSGCKDSHTYLQVHSECMMHTVCADSAYPGAFVLQLCSLYVGPAVREVLVSRVTPDPGPCLVCCTPP